MRRRRISVGFSVTIDLCGMETQKKLGIIPSFFCLLDVIFYLCIQYLVHGKS